VWLEWEIGKLRKRSDRRVLMLVVAIGLALLAASDDAAARSAGISLASGNPGTVGGPATCLDCHAHNPPAPQLALSGPLSLDVGEVATYTLTVTTSQSACGLDVSTTTGLLAVIDAGTRLLDGEVTHNAPRVVEMGQCEFDFEFEAPQNSGPLTIFASALGANLNGNTSGDSFGQISLEVLVEAAELNETLCNDEVDNDADEFIDCADSDCDAVLACEFGTEMSCIDEFDNDGDGSVDCADSDCSALPRCTGMAETLCEDGIDNDQDGFVDCADRDCLGGNTCPFGAVTEVIGPSGDGVAALDGPNDLAFDSSGRLHVAGVLSDNVFRVTPQGLIELVLDGSVVGVDMPGGVVSDPDGRIYVSGFGSGNVVRIDPGGAITELIDSTGDGSNSLVNPADLTVDASGNLYVPGFGSDNVFLVTSNGSSSEVVDSTGDGMNPLDAPVEVAIDAAGHVYIGAKNSNNVFRFDPASRTSQQIMGPEGDGEAELLEAQDVAVDAAGQVYVVGKGSDNVFRLNETGRPELILDATGDGVNGLDFPTDLVVDDSFNVYVSGRDSNNVLRVSPEGEVVQVLDGASSGVSEPGGLAVDSEGNLYVSGRESDNVVRVSPTGPVELGVERIAQGLVAPVYATSPAGDQRVFVVQQTGEIRIARGGELLATPYLDLPDGVVTDPTRPGMAECGMIGLVFPPDFESERCFFVNYTTPSASHDCGISRTSRFHVADSADDTVDAASEEILLDIEVQTRIHHAGHLAFGPEPEPTLYISVGDGGPANDPSGFAQDDGSRLGKMLRFGASCVEGEGLEVPLPGPNTTNEIWAKGLRNPYRFSFDRVTGDLYIGDVGQRDVEEINFESASSNGGLNYGWRAFEGTACNRNIQPADPLCATPELTTPPIFEYAHGHGARRCGAGGAVTAGYVYRGVIDEIFGHFFFADFCQGFIRTFLPDGTGGIIGGGIRDRTAELTPDEGALEVVTGFGEDGRGELLIVDYGVDPFNGSGEVYRVVPEPGSMEMALSVLLALALLAQMERRIGCVSRRRSGDDGRA
jgi:glucose/arabinose dehydrogenase